jgi:hypothetical protein
VRRLLLFLILAVFLPISAHAQSGITTVTATVIDQNGKVYRGCWVQASFQTPINATTQPLLSGSTFQTVVPAVQCDSFGRFTLNLADNSQIQCGVGAGCGQWKITIRSADVCFVGQQFAFGLTLTISGATMAIDAQVTAASVPLPTCSGGGTLTNFSAGDLPPLFTTSVSNSTTTPNLSFSLVNAPPNTYFGNNTGVPALPTYVTIACAGIPSSICGTGTATFLPVFTGPQTIGNSLWTDTGGISTYGGTIVKSPEFDATGVSPGLVQFFNGAGTFSVGLSVNNPAANYTINLPDVIAANPGDTFSVDTIVGPVVQLKWVAGGGGGGSGSTIFPFDQCSPAQVVNQGNSFWSVANLTNWDAGHWEFVLNTAADLYCSIRLPDTVTTTTAHVILEMAANDATAGHTDAIQTCDNIITTGTIDVGALTCAANQDFTTTATAYQRVTLTYVVQASVAAGNILVVKIHQTQSAVVTANLFMWPYVQINQ